MEIQNQISKFSINPLSGASGATTLFVSKIHPKMGQILILGEIQHPQGDNIMKKIIAGVKEEYFDSQTHNTERALESALQKINQAISQIVKEEGKEWLLMSSIGILALNNTEAHLSKIGPLRVFLIQGNAIQDIAEEGVLSEVNPIKAFSNVLSGELQTQTSLFITTEPVLDYVSQEKIRRIIEQNDIKEVDEKLKDLLEKAPKNKSFSGFIIKREGAKEKAKTKAQKYVTENVDIVPPDEPKELEEPQIQEKELKLPKKEAPKKFDYFKKPKRDYFTGLKNLSKIKKIALGLIAILILIFIFNLGESDEKKNRKAELAQVKSLLEQINQKQEQISTAGIYSGKKTALPILKEVENLISQLPENTDERKAQKHSLAAQNKKDLIALYGIQVLNPPTLVSELSISPREMVKKGKKLYILEPNTLNIYSLGIESKKTEKLPITAEKANNLVRRIGVSDNSIFFLSEGNTLAEFNVKEKKVVGLEFPKAPVPKILTDGAVYGNRLYILDEASAQIYKYPKSLAGFGGGAAWIADPSVDISSAVSMTIDSNIWVLKSRGEIIKLFKGKKEAFSASLEPALEAPTKIYTDSDSRYIYILDHGSKRVVVLSKETGSVKAQYTSEQFDNLLDFAVEEVKGKYTIYMLNGQRVYVIGE